MDNISNDKSKTGLSRTALNFWVDVVTALVFAAMVGTGILAKWILPPGSRGGEGLVWFGQGRHFWGDIHFWIGIAMLVLIIVHIWLHWSWVIVTWNKFMGSTKSPVSWIAIIILLAIMLLPLIVPRQFSQSYLDKHEKQEQEAEKIYKGMVDE